MNTDGISDISEVPLRIHDHQHSFGKSLCLRTVFKKWTGAGTFVIFTEEKAIVCTGWLMVTQHFWVLLKQAMTSGNPIVCYVQGRKC